MSTRLLFSSRDGLQQLDDKKPLSIEKSLAELDTLLSREEGVQVARALDTDEIRSPKSVYSFPVKELRQGELEACLGQQLDISARSARFLNDDTKSVSSNTIMSRDVTVYSEDLIYNMEQVQVAQEEHDNTAKSSSSRRSRRSRSCSASRRTKRGDSLERDISRIILQQTCDSSQFVIEPQHKSALHILNDLMASPLPLSQIEEPASRSQDLNRSLRSLSLLDGKDEASALSSEGLEDKTVFLDFLIDSIKASNDTPVRASYEMSSHSKLLCASSEETSASRDAWSFEGSQDSITDELEVGEDIFGDLQDSDSESLEQEATPAQEKSIYSLGVGDFSAEPSPEESESCIKESVARAGLLVVPPPMKLRPPSPPNDENVDPSDDETYLEHRRGMDTFPVEKLDTTCQTTIVHDDNSDDDDDWTTFGGGSAFGDSFSPVKRGASPTPTEAEGPESPTSVLNVLIRDDLNLSPFPDDGDNWGTAFPEASSSDAEWEECSRLIEI
jgi:hypothetical protein